MLQVFDASLWVDFIFPLSVAALAAATFKAFARAGARNTAAEDGNRLPQEARRV